MPTRNYLFSLRLPYSGRAAVHREPVGKRTAAAVAFADDPGGDTTGHQP
ncbi:hypothetical protein [Streptomyces hypolithicus]